MRAKSILIGFSVSTCTFMFPVLWFEERLGWLVGTSSAQDHANILLQWYRLILMCILCWFCVTFDLCVKEFFFNVTTKDINSVTFSAWNTNDEYQILYAQLVIHFTEKHSELTFVVRVYESRKKCILLFCVGCWSVLHGVVSGRTGRGMFTSVQSRGPGTAVTSSIFKASLSLLLHCLTIDLSIKHVLKLPK